MLSRLPIFTEFCVVGRPNPIVLVDMGIVLAFMLFGVTVTGVAVLFDVEVLLFNVLSSTLSSALSSVLSSELLSYDCPSSSSPESS